MTDKRDSSRQRQARQNRAAKESLAARREKAAAAAEQAEAEAKAAEKAAKSDSSAGTKSSSRTTPKSGSNGSAKNGSSSGAVKPDAVDGRPSRARTGRPTGPSPVPDTGPGLRGWMDAVREVPGARGVLIFAIVSWLGAAVLVLFLKPPYVYHFADAIAARAKGVKYTQVSVSKTLADRFGPIVYVVVLMPVILSIVALNALRRPQRRVIWFACAVSMVAWFVVGGQLMVPFSYVMIIAMGYGAWKTSKAERVILE